MFDLVSYRCRRLRLKLLFPWNLPKKFRFYRCLLVPFCGYPTLPPAPSPHSSSPSSSLFLCFPFLLHPPPLARATLRFCPFLRDLPPNWAGCGSASPKCGFIIGRCHGILLLPTCRGFDTLSNSLCPFSTTVLTKPFGKI